MKFKVVGKELIKKAATGQKWTVFHCVTDDKCKEQPGGTFGGVKVHQLMLDYDAVHDSIYVGEEYEPITEQFLTSKGMQTRIIGLA